MSVSTVVPRAETCPCPRAVPGESNRMCIRLTEAVLTCRSWPASSANTRQSDRLTNRHQTDVLLLSVKKHFWSQPTDQN